MSEQSVTLAPPFIVEDQFQILPLPLFTVWPWASWVIMSSVASSIK